MLRVAGLAVAAVSVSIFIGGDRQDYLSYNRIAGAGCRGADDGDVDDRGFAELEVEAEELTGQVRPGLLFQRKGKAGRQVGRSKVGRQRGIGRRWMSADTAAKREWLFRTDQSRCGCVVGQSTRCSGVVGGREAGVLESLGAWSGGRKLSGDM